MLGLLLLLEILHDILRILGDLSRGDGPSELGKRAQAAVRRQSVGLQWSPLRGHCDKITFKPRGKVTRDLRGKTKTILSFQIELWKRIFLRFLFLCMFIGFVSVYSSFNSFLMRFCID